MKRVKKILSNNQGLSSIWAVIILMISLLIFMAIFEYVRLNIIAEGVRDAVQSVVIGACNDNYGNTYPGAREGYSGGYKSNGSTWSSLVSKGDIYGRLDDLLGLTVSGSKHNKLRSSNTEFSVYGMSVSISNAPFAPSSKSGIQQFTITTKLTLEVPMSFFGESMQPMIITLQVKSKYVPKF